MCGKGEAKSELISVKTLLVEKIKTVVSLLSSTHDALCTKYFEPLNIINKRKSKINNELLAKVSGKPLCLYEIFCFSRPLN